MPPRAAADNLQRRVRAHRARCAGRAHVGLGCLHPAGHVRSPPPSDVPPGRPAHRWWHGPGGSGRQRRLRPAGRG
ncbi:hypothetical protein G6F23_015439 [Rhizopus arrhizus]|nr:hypothetical protein G6F23_015439 [Rhizopus arrhizus]